MTDDPIGELISAGAAAHVSSLAEEWQAARHGCAVFPAVHRAIARASGEDRVSFLQGMLTNDIRRLQPGQGLSAAFLTDSGKVVSDMRVYCDAAGFDLDCLAWRLQRLCDGLEKFIIADDVEIERLDMRAALVCLEGPDCASVTGAVFGAAVDVPPQGVATARFDDQDVTLHGVSDCGGAGVLVVGPLPLRQSLMQACRDAGAQPAGLRTLDVLRVEAGIPWVGIDMGEDTLLMEMGVPEMISRTKGCYLGQEVVERVSARGQVNRTLTAFAIDADGDHLPRAGLEVQTEAGVTVGQITSCVPSPALGGPLAMGLLHRKGREAGLLRVLSEAGPLPCRVVDFPSAARS